MRREAKSFLVPLQLCRHARKTDETVASYRSGNSAVGIRSGLWSGDELLGDGEEPADQLVDHRAEREESQPVLMESVFEAAENI